MSISLRAIEQGNPIRDRKLANEVAQKNSKDGRSPVVDIRKVGDRTYVLVYPTGFFHGKGPKVMDVTDTNSAGARTQIASELSKMHYPVNTRRIAVATMAAGLIGTGVGIPVFKSVSHEGDERASDLKTTKHSSLQGKTSIPDMPISSRAELAEALRTYLATIYNDNLKSSNSESREQFAPLIKRSLKYWGNDDKNWDLDHVSAIGAAKPDRKTKKIFFTLNESLMREYWQHRNEPIGRALFEAIAIKEGVHLTEYESDFDGTLSKFSNLNTLLKKYRETMRTLMGISSASTETNFTVTGDILCKPELVEISKDILKMFVNKEFTGYLAEADYFRSNRITRDDLAKELSSQSNQESLYSSALSTNITDLEFIGNNNPNNERLFKLVFILGMTNNPQAALRFPAVSIALSLLSINDPDGKIIAPQQDGSFQLNYGNPNLEKLANKHLGFLD